MGKIPFLPARLYTLTAISAVLSFSILLHTTAVMRGWSSYYEWTNLCCRISLGYYTVALLASSRARPTSFPKKWSLIIATGIALAFIALIYDSVPNTIRDLVKRIRHVPTYREPLWQLAVLSVLELLQAAVCGIILHRSLDDETWAEVEGSISLPMNNDEEQARA